MIPVVGVHASERPVKFAQSNKSANRSSIAVLGRSSYLFSRIIQSLADRRGVENPGSLPGTSHSINCLSLLACSFVNGFESSKMNRGSHSTQ